VLDRIARAAVVFAFSTSLSRGQLTPGDPVPSDPASRHEIHNPAPAESKRILGIIPNYRTSPSLQNYQPLTIREKFKLASQDAFDPGTFVQAALIAGQGQLTNANRSFGQGGAGFGRYFGAAYSDAVIGNYMTEAVFPVLLRQDPRYFRRGTGSGWSRLGYAMGQIFWTYRDSGGTQFNYSELLGNSTSVTISQAYYANNRSASDAAGKLAMQLGADMVGNILKEFWPDLNRKFKRKHLPDTAPKSN